MNHFRFRTDVIVDGFWIDNNKRALNAKIDRWNEVYWGNFTTAAQLVIPDAALWHWIENWDGCISMITENIVLGMDFIRITRFILHTPAGNKKYIETCIEIEFQERTHTSCSTRVNASCTYCIHHLVDLIMIWLGFNEKPNWIEFPFSETWN